MNVHKTEWMILEPRDFFDQIIIQVEVKRVLINNVRGYGAAAYTVHANSISGANALAKVAQK